MYLVKPSLVKNNVCTGDGKKPPKDARERRESQTVLKSLFMKTTGVKRKYGASDSDIMLLSLTSNTQLEGVKQIALLAGSYIS